MEDFKQYLKLINNCDPSDPLLSSTTLGERLNKIPLNSVNRSDLNYLTQVLNSEQLIPTESGLARDYRGLGERMGFSSIEIENCIKRSYNPTRSLIDAYICGNKDVTLNDLLKLIEDIERFDVIDDIMPTLMNLATIGGDQLKVSIRNDDRRALDYNYKDEPRPLVAQTSDDQLKEFNRLTIDDVPHSAVIIYDAFICFAPQDLEYAKDLIDFLEANGKSVATADDLLPGHFEHDALARFIDKRCRKVIIILTPNFLNSKECEFPTKFANEIGIKAESPKIIPVFYKYCDDSMLPSMIKVLSKIDLTSRAASREWQLHRLIKSLSGDDNETTQLMMNNRNIFSRRLTQFNNSGRINSGGQMVATNSNDSYSTDQDQIIKSHGPVPVITYSKSIEQYESSHHHHHHHKPSVSPIIDIMDSKSSGELESEQSTTNKLTARGGPHPHPNLNQSLVAPPVTTNSNNPIIWLKKQVTWRGWRNEPGLVHTSTSQSVLISPANADDENSFQQQANGGT